MLHCWVSARQDEFPEFGVEFLDRDETRGVRLQLDYSKRDLLWPHGVQHTVVVFGSSRIPEQAAARGTVRRTPE